MTNLFPICIKVNKTTLDAIDEKVRHKHGRSRSNVIRNALADYLRACSIKGSAARQISKELGSFTARKHNRT